MFIMRAYPGFKKRVTKEKFPYSGLKEKEIYGIIRKHIGGAL